MTDERLKEIREPVKSAIAELQGIGVWVPVAGKPVEEWPELPGEELEIT